MSRIIAIHWNEHHAQAVVVKWRTTNTWIEAVLNVPLPDECDAQTTGHCLAEALEPYRKGRHQTIVCVDRNQLQWQQLSLPPASKEELPELVRFQFERETSSAEEETGFDYLSLSGDEETPHQVLAIGIAHDELTEIRQTIEAAELKLDRLVPIQVGRIALVRRAVMMQKEWHSSPNTSQVFAVLTADNATIWAMIQERVVLLRTLRIPQADDEITLSNMLTRQLQRTRLALAQSHPLHPVAGVWLAGRLANRALTGTTSAQLDLPVHAVEVTAPFDNANYSINAGNGASGNEDQRLANTESTLTASNAHFPLAGLALDETESRAPLIDLINPRHATEPTDLRRTYVLAVAAVVSFLMLGSWLGYRSISVPQQATEIAERELTELEGSIEEYKKDEVHAAAIQAWTSGSVNLLDELEALSTKLRPEPLNNKDFVVDADLVVQSLNLQGQQFTVDAVAKNENVASQLEIRLRDDKQRVVRENAKQTAALETYTWPFRILLENAEEITTTPGGGTP